MKTSLKLLVGLCAAVMLTIIGAGWSFRQQYDQLDHADPFAQYAKQALPAFRVLKITGTPGEVFLVQPGTAANLRVRTVDQPLVTFRSIGDTLLIRYVSRVGDPGDDNGTQAGSALRGEPIAVVSVPTLQTVVVEKTNCKLANWQLASLTLTQTGPNGVTGLANMTIGTLQATVSGGSLLKTGEKNAIGQATVTVKDRASFVVAETSVTSLTLRADSAATVTLPGNLLRRMQ